MIIINWELLTKQLKSNYSNKEVKELIEIKSLINEIKMISNKEEVRLKQFNKESLIYLKSLLLQSEDYNTALKSAREYQKQKSQFKQFDIAMDRIITLLNSFNKDKLSKSENLARELAENKPFKTSSNKTYNNKSWKKNKFYE